MATYILMGGKSVDNTENNIYREICIRTKKPNPKILFVGLASKNSSKSYLIFCNLCSSLTTNIDYNDDKLLSNPKMIFEYDALFFTGGDTENLVEAVYKYHIYEELINYAKLDKVLSGVSAGAILFFANGMGDKYSYQDNFHTYNFKMTKGIGLFKETFCPHYQKEDLICFDDELKFYHENAFAFEDNTALIIHGDIFEVVKDDSKCSCYYFDKEKDYLLIPLYPGILYKM